jgi:hypothetical protein
LEKNGIAEIGGYVTNKRRIDDTLEYACLGCYKDARQFV